MVRFAILYFVMLIIFLILIVGPGVAGGKLYKTNNLASSGGILGSLMQPSGQNNNDTISKQTGTHVQKEHQSAKSTASASSSGGGGGGGSSDMERRFMLY